MKPCKSCKFAAVCSIDGIVGVIQTIGNTVNPTTLKCRVETYNKLMAALPEDCPQIQERMPCDEERSMQDV